jgi:hypothetical protein
MGQRNDRSELSGGIKLLVSVSKRCTQSKNVIFVFLAERVLEALGVCGDLKQENSQEEKAGFTIHAGRSVKQDA